MQTGRNGEYSKPARPFEKELQSTQVKKKHVDECVKPKEEGALKLFYRKRLYIAIT